MRIFRAVYVMKFSIHQGNYFSGTTVRNRLAMSLDLGLYMLRGNYKNCQRHRSIAINVMQHRTY